MGMTLRSLETYGYISKRLKAIKYKEDFSCYLSIPLRPSYQAQPLGLQICLNNF